MEKAYKEILPMTKMIDFSDAKLSFRNLEYGGRAGKKKGLYLTMNFGFLNSLKTLLV